MACHLRSASVPSTPRSDEASVEEQLRILNAAVSSPSSTIGAMVAGLRELGSIHSRIDALTYLPPRSSQRKAAEEELDRSLALLDLCGAVQERLAELRAGAQEMRLALRRGDGAALRASALRYARSARKAQKLVRNRKVGGKTASDVAGGCRVVELVAEAREVAASILESTVQLLAKRVAMPGSSSKWSLVAKSFQKKRVLCEAEQLRGVELDVADLESGVGTLFRTLIRSRVSLLNTLSL